MESGAGTNLVQGDDQQEFPQIFPRRDIVSPRACRVEEVAENRLNDVVRVEAAGEYGRAFPTGQRAQAIGVALVEQRRRVPVTLLVALEQVLVRIGSGRIRCGQFHCEFLSGSKPAHMTNRELLVTILREEDTWNK